MALYAANAASTCAQTVSSPISTMLALLAASESRTVSVP
jgi:hypothetical protein